MIAEGMLTTLALLMRAMTVYLLALRRPSFTDGLLRSWLGVEIAAIAAMLLLSPFGLVTTGAYWILSVAGLAYAARGAARIESWPRPTLLLLPIGLVLAYIAWRSLVFVDFTDDALSYGYVRIGLWMHAGSLLLHEQTPTINLFAYEWNGELVDLAYGLAAHALSGSLAGTVEILAVVYLSAFSLASRFTGSTLWRHTTALLIATTPAVLGIAATVKGDTLAAAACMASLSFALKDGDDPSRNSILCVAFAAFAVGSKISATPVAVVITLCGLWRGRRSITYSTLARSAGISLVAAARYVLNVIQYGRPVLRVPDEHTLSTAANTLAQLSLVLNGMTDYVIRSASQYNYAFEMSAGLGVAGFIAVASAWRFFTESRDYKVLFLVVLAATLLFATLAPVAPWGFRYFLPGLTCLFVMAVASSKPTHWAFALTVFLAVPALDAWWLFWPGALQSNTDFQSGVTKMFNEHALTARTITAAPVRRTIDPHDFYQLATGPSRHVLVYQQQNTTALPLLGENLQNDVHFVEDDLHFKEYMKINHPDLAFYSLERENAPESIVDFMCRAGYAVDADEKQYLIGERADLIRPGQPNACTTR